MKRKRSRGRHPTPYLQKQNMVLYQNQWQRKRKVKGVCTINGMNPSARNCPPTHYTSSLPLTTSVLPPQTAAPTAVAASTHSFPSI